MEQFDKLLKEMAELEECTVPNGFDGRIRGVLDGLPPQAKKRRRLGAAKGVLIAAAACVLLVGTALAASPGLREALATALGGFAPYAQEQDGETYVVNEFEYKVLSAVTDGTTLRVYVQQTDLAEGRFSTDGFDGTLFTHSLQSSFIDHRCVSRDESTGTSLWCISAWGQMDKGADAAALFVTGFTPATKPKDGAEGKMIPLELELMPNRAIVKNAYLDTLALQADRIELSPLGLTIVTKSDADQYDWDLSADIRVCLDGGTQIQPEAERASGQATYSGPDDSYKVMVWNFREPFILDSVAGVYVDGQYFPVK